LLQDRAAKIANPSGLLLAICNHKQTFFSVIGKTHRDLELHAHSLRPHPIKVETHMRKSLCIVPSILYLSFPVHTLGQTTPNPALKRFVSAALVRKTATGAARPAQASQPPAAEVDFTWSYTPTLPACTTVPKSCYDGFTMTYADTGNVIATPSTLGPAALSYNWVPTSGVPYGSLNFTLVANGYDDSGNALASEPATVTIKNDVTSLAAPMALPLSTGIPVP
jgi:hypothetical protein